LIWDLGHPTVAKKSKESQILEIVPSLPLFSDPKDRQEIAWGVRKREIGSYELSLEGATEVTITEIIYFPKFFPTPQTEASHFQNFKSQELPLSLLLYEFSPTLAANL
jgi:hypothetical protein